MTIRQNILSNIKTTLEAITDFKKVELNRVTPLDLDIVPLPIVFIFSGNEDKSNETVIGSKAVAKDWEINIELFARDTDMEGLIGKVELEMMKDFRRNGNAETTERTGIEIHVLEPDKSLIGVLMRYNVLYRHQFGIV